MSTLKPTLQLCGYGLLAGVGIYVAGVLLRLEIVFMVGFVIGSMSCMIGMLAAFGALTSYLTACPQVRVPPGIPESDSKRSSPCHFTTHEHLQSAFGKLRFRTGSGSVTLTPAAVVCDVTWPTPTQSIVPSEIRLEDVSGLEVGTFSRWLHPAGLNYLALSYGVGQAQSTFLLVPYSPGNQLHQKTNALVEEWEAAIQEAVQACKK